jgi:hypothetical protein
MCCGRASRLAKFHRARPTVEDIVSAKALKLPIVVTNTARDSMWGPTFPELVEALPGLEIIDRSSANAFDDARVTRAIEATGRQLIFAGLSLEVCAALPAITAVG